MDNIFGEVVLTSGDKDLGAAQFIIAICRGHGQGTNHSQIGAGVGFRQTHTARPGSVIHPGEILFLEFGAAKSAEAMGDAGGEHGIKRE